MALIDKETIRKEIERRLSWRITLEARAAYNNILRFLDSLPEQPVPTIMTNEMLMGEIKLKKKSNALFDKCVENCDPAVMKEVSDNVDKMLGRQPVEGLEETADLLAIAHLQGMEQQKAKMMEEAVEANLLSVEGDSYGIVSYTFQGRRFPAAFSGKCFSYKIIVIKDEK